MLPLLTGELLEMCHCSVGFSKYSKPHKSCGFERIYSKYGHEQEGTSLRLVSKFQGTRIKIEDFIGV